LEGLGTVVKKKIFTFIRYRTQSPRL
jgi:hypothetical protein